jgi:hypothetical protein
MWEKLVARMVARVMPLGIADPGQHLLAAEAAENGIRYAWRVAGLAAAVALMLNTVLVYAYFPQRGVHRTSEAAEAAGSLSASNAILRLGAANDSLQVQLTGMTRERDALRGKVTELEKHVASLRVRLDSALTAAARWEKQAREYAAREVGRGMAASGK